MTGEHDSGDETPGEHANAPKRFFTVEEAHEVTGGSDCRHWIVAKDMGHALEVLALVDASDAKRVEIVEITSEQAGMLNVHDTDHNDRFALTEALMGSLFSEEY